MMSIGRRAAKFDVADDVIGELAPRIAGGVAEAQGVIDLAAERHRHRLMTQLVPREFP